MRTSCVCIKIKLDIWSVGQAAKTSPSHGENRGSIPLQTATVYNINSPTRKELVKSLDFIGFFYK